MYFPISRKFPNFSKTFFYPIFCKHHVFFHAILFTDNAKIVDVLVKYNIEVFSPIDEEIDGEHEEKQLPLLGMKNDLRET